jgi:nitroreductase
MDIATCDELLTTTRAVRRRLDLTRDVPDDVITDCITVAIQAPTGGNQQAWRWLVIRDAATRTKIADIYRAVENGGFARRAARLESSDPQTSRVYRGASALLDVIDQVPVMVIPCALGRVDGASNDVASGFYGSIIPAVWSFMLALRSRGLGSVWISRHLEREADLAELLGIPPDVSQITLLPVAYTIGTDFRRAQRAPVESVMYRDRWGEA